MSDEGLDNLFRKGLSERDVNFNMESWRRMEEMLPPEPKASNFKFGYAAAIIGLFLMVSASLFIWNTDNSDSFALNTTGVEGTNSSTSTLTNTTNSDKELNAKSDLDGESYTNTNHETTHADLDSEKSSNLSNAEFTKQGKNSQNSHQSTNSEPIVTNSTSALTNAQQMAYGGSKGNSLFAQNKTRKGFFSRSNNSNDSDDDSEAKMERMSFASNAFTKIDGVGELAALDLSSEGDKHTLVTDVTDGKRPKVSKNVFGFIGGVNLNPSLVESPEKGISGSEFLGVEYQRYLNGGISLKADLIYSARNGINSSKVYDKKIYDFGSQTEQTTVECQRMVYIELPVLFNYGVANHNFMVGPSVSYLASSLNKVTTAYETPTSSWEEEKPVWGYTDGFKQYDFAIVAGYEYSLKPKLNLGVRLNYGLIDITDNNYFDNDSFDNNVQFRVYLTYSPFQF